MNKQLRGKQKIILIIKEEKRKQKGVETSIGEHQIVMTEQQRASKRIKKQKGAARIGWIMGNCA